MDNPNFQFKHNQSLGFSLWKTTTIWQREIKAILKEFNLSHSDFVILSILLWQEKNEINQTLIIEHSKLDKMTVSQSIKKLVLKDLVTRVENEDDTRAKNVSISKNGKNIIIKAVKKVEEYDNYFFSKLNNKEQDELNSSFTKLIQG